MTDAELNKPAVVAEVSALFEIYEQALIDRNVDVLDATFWKARIPFATRCGRTDMGSTPSMHTG